MQAAADILARLQRAALRRRAPSWLAAVLPWVLLLAPVGAGLALAWAAWDWWRLRKRVRMQWIGWLDRSLPTLEDSAALLVEANDPIARMQRTRILQRLETDLRDDVVAAIVRERVRFDVPVAGASAALALAVLAWNGLSSTPVTASAVLARLAEETGELVLRVTPPRHTGAARFDSGARDLEVAQGSVVEWCLRALQPVEGKVELGDGRVLAVGQRCARVTAIGPLLWRWRGRRFALRVRADAPPQVAILTPQERVHPLPEDAHSAAIALRLRDDYRLRRATLHLTLARGSGEDLSFSEREIAVPGVQDVRTRSWSYRIGIGQLGLRPGDEVHFHVRATDNAPVPQTSTSPVYTLRLSAPGARAPTLAAYQRAARPATLDDEQADVDGAAGYRRVQGARSEALPPQIRALIAALAGNGPLPAGWQRTALGWLAADPLGAQRAVQDVQDGCTRCRPALRARLRHAALETAPALGVATAADTPFARAWQGRGTP